ncbi:hypothetical protein KUH32_11735 [Thalassococcus sp. CAU 1522]|uniref:Uncharacterized protein n=1 Tax=Thalassococcus arenae TaxID=2851652 RepID=A0ABS6N9F8_9RHOB|nr:hypothetical protein [Thalassococcus arenae]MBV2360448.1 hypothetical protein [Thalassococcus arenae]
MTDRPKRAPSLREAPLDRCELICRAFDFGAGPALSIEAMLDALEARNWSLRPW